MSFRIRSTFLSHLRCLKDDDDDKGKERNQDELSKQEGEVSELECISYFTQSLVISLCKYSLVNSNLLSNGMDWSVCHSRDYYNRRGENVHKIPKTQLP